MSVRSLIIDGIIKLAQRKPYYHIHGKDGTVYMYRWWLFKPTWWCPYGLRVHNIVRPDADEHMHDHPFNFWVRIMRGYYIERSIDRIKFCSCYSGYYSPADRFHKIVAVAPGGAWTLFLHGPRIQSWGFLVDGTKVHWRTYLDSDMSTHKNPYNEDAKYQ